MKKGKKLVKERNKMIVNLKRYLCFCRRQSTHFGGYFNLIKHYEFCGGIFFSFRLRWHSDIDGVNYNYYLVG